MNPNEPGSGMCPMKDTWTHANIDCSVFWITQLRMHSKSSKHSLLLSWNRPSPKNTNHNLSRRGVRYLHICKVGHLLFKQGQVGGTFDGAEIWRSPLEVGSSSHYLPCFLLNLKGCLGFLPSTVWYSHNHDVNPSELVFQSRMAVEL